MADEANYDESLVPDDVLPHAIQQPLPVFLGLNFSGNHTVNDDAGIRLSTAWMRAAPEHGVVEHHASRCPIQQILERLLGQPGVGSNQRPQVDGPLTEGSYHIRTGGHDVTSWNWHRWMDFADRNLGC